MSDSTFLTRVELLNYKSIAHCSVELRPLVFLVGPNGAGKSNFLDALRFVSDALNNPLDHAIRERGGIREVYRRKSGLNQPLFIRLHFHLPTGAAGYYFFRIRRNAKYEYWLQTEECHIYPNGDRTKEAYYRVANGKVTTSERVMPAAFPDRLFLVAASGIPAFRPVYDALSRMAFYNLNLESIRVPQKPDSDEVLSRNGDNLARVLARLERHAPKIKQRMEAYLAAVVPGITGVNVKDVGGYETLQFQQENPNGSFPLVFPASSMSDGTLRALGILAVLFQKGKNENNPISLVGIEEPETALHPAAVEALLDAMSEASESKQILVTSHSADLLDSKDITADMLLGVVAEGGVTKIGPIDRAGQYALREHLYTAGELQRMNQLRPDLSSEADSETGNALLPVDNAA